jgi:YidC/Oxa1 family membrane protein insertase
MLPLTIKQQKFSKLSARMNPELQKIQAKYKGKKDQPSLQKMQIEQQAVYEKYGANPTSGCLPLLIQLPLMFALYDVIVNVPAYVTKIKEMYLPIADQIFNVGNVDKLTALAKTTSRLKNWHEFPNTDKIITLLYNLSTSGQKQLIKDFPALSDTITTAFHKIDPINNFFGMSIIDTPGFSFPGILIPILAAVLSYVQSKQVQVKTTDNKDNPAASAMNSMMYVMPAMQFFFCITFPLGIGVYWVATSIFTIIQQYFVNKVLDKMDVDELVEKSQQKAAKKKAKKVERTGDATSPMSLRDLATRQTKNIESTINEKVSSTDNTDESENQNSSEETKSEINEDNQVSTAPKSISEIANLLKNKKL